MDRQKIKRKDVLIYWDLLDSEGGTYFGEHYINYKVDGKIKRVELKTMSKLWTHDFQKEHKKLKEAINIWMHNR